MNPHDRPSNPLSRLRFALETIHSSRKCVFTPATCAEVLSELYNAFWGPYAHLFLPLSNSSLPMHATPSQVQAELGFGGPCQVVLGIYKGRKLFPMQVSAALTFSPLPHSFLSETALLMKVVLFAVAASVPVSIGATASVSSLHSSTVGPKSPLKNISDVDIPPAANCPFRAAFPPELRENMDELSVPSNEADLRLQPAADPMQKDQHSVIIWNGDKRSFDEVIQLIRDATNRDRKEATAVAHTIDERGCEIIDMNANVPRLLEIAQVISKIKIGITIRRAYDAFREQVVAVIIERLLNLTRSRLGTDALIREVLMDYRASARLSHAEMKVIKNIILAGSPTCPNRQFLFKKKDVKRSKAMVAAQTAGAFDPNEFQFDVEWFQPFDIVLNALDNLASIIRQTHAEPSSKIQPSPAPKDQGEAIAATLPMAAWADACNCIKASVPLDSRRTFVPDFSDPLTAP
ncbi:hypothetical protein EV363DRAFT_1454493 [Boletus edulis]|nr:hypothetical protein EV363DRAFT_1454493 [Boletus edulis]